MTRRVAPSVPHATVTLTPQAETFDSGELVELHATFTTLGQPVKPGRVVCMVKPARGGEPVRVPVEENGDGYLARVVPDVAGTWRFSFDAQGSHLGAGESFFYVQARRVPR